MIRNDPAGTAAGIPIWNLGVSSRGVSYCVAICIPKRLLKVFTFIYCERQTHREKQKEEGLSCSGFLPQMTTRARTPSSAGTAWLGHSYRSRHLLLQDCLSVGSQSQVELGYEPRHPALGVLTSSSLLLKCQMLALSLSFIIILFPLFLNKLAF